MPETSCQAFFFDADANGGVFDPSFLNALGSADPQGSLHSRVLRGDALVDAICTKVTGVSQTPRHQSWTKSYDLELYRTVVWDLVDAFAGQGHTLNLESFPLGRRNIYCIVLPTFLTSLHQKVDAQLRATPGYLGSVEVDLGNPIQVTIFIKHLIDDAFIADGAVYLEQDWEGMDGTIFDGSDAFRPSGERRLPPVEFDEQRPPLPAIKAVSPRGKTSVERYQGKRTFSLEDRIMKAIGDLPHSGRTSFAFTSQSGESSILEAELSEAKFIRYLLNPDHPKGGGKAKFFREVLAIGPEDWRYLAAQFYDGLMRADFSSLRIKQWEDGFGASFDCTLQIRGLNGQTARILTNWIVRPGRLPQLSTALPADKNADAVTSSEPAVIATTLPEGERWQQIYKLADDAGTRAVEQCIPTPMKISGFPVIMDGMCGLASIRIPDARRGFARWIIRSNNGSRHYKGGAQILYSHPTQSVDRAMAYANAFASVLKLNGIECSVERILD